VLVGPFGQEGQYWPTVPSCDDRRAPFGLMRFGRPAYHTNLANDTIGSLCDESRHVHATNNVCVYVCERKVCTCADNVHRYKRTDSHATITDTVWNAMVSIQRRRCTQPGASLLQANLQGQEIHDRIFHQHCKPKRTIQERIKKCFVCRSPCTV
jgi:hypothetical protein